MIPTVLNCIETFVWWVETNLSSIVLFGEYPFPERNEEE